MKPIDILIVEDELLIARNLARKLSKLGYNIIGIVSSGEMALQFVAEKPPRLVLMDIVIKGQIDGIEAATKIYKNYGIPVVYLTAYADDETLRRAEQSGAYGYLLKPFKERELHATIRMALHKHQQEAELLGTLEVAEQMSKKLQATIKTTVLKIGGSEELALEKDLQSALERQELQVYYQPLVKLQNRQIIGAEALLRWHHPKRGLVSPAAFIPLAEETGLIEPIGEWVLREACTQVKAWQTASSFPLQVSVNLSACQFQQKGLAQKVGHILAATQLEPEFLNLELTESLFIHDTVSVLERIDELKMLGLELAIDDFGIGYSSLAYLQRFPFDIVKIDRCFIRNITQNPDKVALTKAIIEIGHSLNLKVIAEGVETEEEIEFLRQNQCDIAQGYLFSRPVPAEDFQRDLSQKGI